MITDPLPVARFVADRYGWTTPKAMTYAADGAMGRVWRLDAGGESYAVKEPYWAKDAEVENAAVERQVHFCNVARAAGIAAPANLQTQSGEYVVELPDELGGRLVRAYEWMDGHPLPHVDAESRAWAGRTEAMIENLAMPADDHELDPWSYRAPSSEIWDELASRCDAAHQPWADRLQQTIPQFVALADLMSAPDLDDLIITHTDFQPHNVLVDDNGRYVLLDWDDSGPSTRTRALGSLINNWHIHGPSVDPEAVRQTMRSYRAAGGTAAITQVDDFGDAICGYLNYVHGQAELSLDHSQPDQLRLEAGQRMPGLLSPLPLTVYEHAIAAAT